MQLRILGPFEVRLGNKAVTPTAPKLRRVLALLAVYANSVVSTGQIIEELWEERPPLSATTTLQTYVYQLRKLMARHTPADRPNPPIEIRTLLGGYMLSIPPQAVDAARFEQLATLGQARAAAGDWLEASAALRSALDLWQGAALTSVEPGPMLHAAAVRLEEIRKSVLDHRIDIDLRLGRYRELIGELTGLVAQYPTHEGLQGKLMLALYRTGRRSDALKVYQQARAAMHRELGLEPSADLRQLHQAMLTTDPGLDAPPIESPAIEVSGASWAASARPRRTQPPRTLPPDVSVLVGRRAESARVRDLLTVDRPTSTAPVVAVTGPPGSGKSAFCVDVAHQLANDYPHGQLYARLSEHDRVVPPSEVLGKFLVAIGVPAARLPESLEERSRLFRSWSIDSRVLVILDDADGPGQIHSLLPAGAGSATIVASRRRSSDPMVCLSITLEPLQRGDARQLLSAVLGPERLAAEPRSVDELLDLCHGLPLALRAAADVLQVRPHWSVELLVRRIEQARARTAGRPFWSEELLGSVLHTYRFMPADTQAAFRALGGIPAGPTSNEVLATLLETDEATAESLLENLAEYQLVGVDRGLGTSLDGSFEYRPHPLFHDVAGWLRAPDDAPRRGGLVRSVSVGSPSI